MTLTVLLFYHHKVLVIMCLYSLTLYALSGSTYRKPKIKYSNCDFLSFTEEWENVNWEDRFEGVYLHICRGQARPRK